jgi:hypothetical protein
MFLAGEIRETSQQKVIKQLTMLQNLEWWVPDTKNQVKTHTHVV